MKQLECLEKGWLCRKKEILLADTWSCSVHFCLWPESCSWPSVMLNYWIILANFFKAICGVSKKWLDRVLQGACFKLFSSLCVKCDFLKTIFALWSPSWAIDVSGNRVTDLRELDQGLYISFQVISIYFDNKLLCTWVILTLQTQYGFGRGRWILFCFVYKWNHEWSTNSLLLTKYLLIVVFVK